MFVLTTVWPSSTWGRPQPLLRLSSSCRPTSCPLCHHLRPHLHALSTLLPGGNCERCRCGGRGSGGSQGGAQGSTHVATPTTRQWPSFLNPWTGSIHMWPGSTAGGARGPPPRAVQPAPPPQQALVAGVPPVYFAPPPASETYYPPPPQAPSPAWSPWTPEGPANAFSTVTLTPPPSSSNWVIDAGASSHITANPGGHPFATLFLSFLHCLRQ